MTDAGAGRRPSTEDAAAAKGGAAGTGEHRRAAVGSAAVAAAVLRRAGLPRRRVQRRRDPAASRPTPGAVSLAVWTRFLQAARSTWGCSGSRFGSRSTVSVVVVLLAYPIGYFLALCVRKRKYVLLLVDHRAVPDELPPARARVEGDARGTRAWSTRCWSRSTCGAANEPIEWLLYSQFTVMLVLAYVWIPFVALPIFVSLDNLDR